MRLPIILRPWVWANLWQRWKLYRRQRQLYRQLIAEADARRAPILRVGGIATIRDWRGRPIRYQLLNWKFGEIPVGMDFVRIDEHGRQRIAGYTITELREIMKQPTEFETADR